MLCAFSSGGNPIVPPGWAVCDGQILSIANNTSLFALLGTNYGGNGITTFALPDLRGRVPIEAGTIQSTSFVIGQSGGEVTHTLSLTELTTHNHA
jgi:microcystin-dependent protein